MRLGHPILLILLILFMNSCKPINYEFKTNRFSIIYDFNIEKSKKDQVINGKIVVYKDNSVKIETDNNTYEFNFTSSSISQTGEYKLNIGDCYFLLCGNDFTCEESGLESLKKGIDMNSLSQEDLTELIIKSYPMVCVDKYGRRCDILINGKTLSFYNND
jgi:hypothetical protein